MVALVLGTFMPFHQGHEALINFANEVGDGVLVLMSSRSQEPISGGQRIRAIRDTFRGDAGVKVWHHMDDRAPQAPIDENDVAFWEYWVNVVNMSHECAYSNYSPITCVVSSESYGDKMAAALGVPHIKFDQDRAIIGVKGTPIRRNPMFHFNSLNPYMAREIRSKYVMFGAESVGKSTMTTELHHRLGEAFLCTPEWARPFLEGQEDKSASVANMHQIFRGQYAMEQAVSKQLTTHIGVVMDTDIMSTFGYAKLTGMDSYDYTHMIPRDGRKYFLLAQDGVPFEEDELRYGGDRRESEDSFWMKLLEDHNIDYVYVQGSFQERVNQIMCAIVADIKSKFNFEREQNG